MPDADPVEPSSRSIIFDTLGSTNQEGLERARRGETGPLWIRALAQTQGRGRIGRPWSSPLGNLYTSLLLSNPAELRVAPQLGFVAGVALARAVRSLPGVNDGVRLKWPNDLVHHGAKLAGILVEGCQMPNGAFACVIGFGVNCVSHPVGLDYPTTDLSTLTGHQQSADDLGRALTVAMADALGVWDRGAGFHALRQSWLDLALDAGAPLTVKGAAGTTHGRFETIDETGRLRLVTSSGVMIVDAGDVFSSAAETICVPSPIDGECGARGI